MKRALAIVLILILSLGGYLTFTAFSTTKPENALELSRLLKPWCASQGLPGGNALVSPHDVREIRSGLKATWLAAGADGFVGCSKNSGSTLIAFTFPTAFDENAWLTNDTGGKYEFAKSIRPNPVFIGTGWVVVLGWRSISEDSTEGQALASLSSKLGVSYYFRTFPRASW